MFQKPTGKPKLYSPSWWQNKDVSIPWCERFCAPFYEQDPTLLESGTHETVGVIFMNRPNGEIVPVGFTALQHGNFIFQYHPSYLANDHVPPISATLPKRAERYVSEGKMLPYFDNLPAEGWFGKAQGAALGDEKCRSNGHYDPHGTHMDGESLAERYHRFMMFGRDYPGAVWATYNRIDPELAAQSHQATIEAALRSRSSISGMQPKLLGVANEAGELHPANYWETSSHIVKLPANNGANMPGLMEYEYMSIIATKALLPNNPCVDAELTNLHLRDGSQQPVLAIKRFDRTPEGNKAHFEEMNQLLGRQNADRYKGSYVDIAKLIDEKIGHEGVKQFYARLMCQFLLGNTDNHMKNFAMYHDMRGNTWSLTPDYDLAPTVNYQKSALALHATPHRHGMGEQSEGSELYNNLSPKVLVRMGQDFGLSYGEIKTIIHDLVGNIDAAKKAVLNDPSERLNRPIGTIMKGHSSSHSNSTMREDFCARIDGRKQQLFGTLDKYIEIQEQKEGRRLG